jgi:AcrR family transcriptional regulator
VTELNDTSNEQPRSRRARTARPAEAVSGRAPGTPKTSRVRMSATQRREQLIAIGRQLFAERGFDATSVEEVAARAMVS